MGQQLAFVNLGIHGRPSGGLDGRNGPCIRQVDSNGRKVEIQALPQWRNCSAGRDLASCELMMRGDFDFEQLWPELSSDEQVIARGGVGDAVEHGAAFVQFAFVDDGAEVDESENFSRVRRDARDVVGLPDVGVDFAVDVFQFVQILDGAAVGVDYLEAANHAKRLRIEKAERRSSVAHDELRGVVRQSPTLALVIEGALQRKAETVVDQRFVGGPRQLDQRAAPVSEAFAEIFRGQVVLLQNVSRSEIDQAH